MIEDHRTTPYAQAVIPLFVVLQLFLAGSAWLCDDAFITLRTVDNFVHGDGLRYNVDERVQAYTHPLWLGVLSVAYVLTEEPYFTTLAVSLLVSLLATFVLVFKVACSPPHALAVMFLLSLSKSFVDFSTSGLENPLTHLLLGAFFWLAMRGGNSRRDLFLLSAVAGLGMVNRLDAALLFLPALSVVAWTSRRARSLGPVAAGMAPLVAWEAFSLVYYGSPLPNTFYAKLGAGIPRRELVEQGVYYLVDAVTRDPVTPALILTASALVLAYRRVPTRLAFVLGMALYLAYTVLIGGDFMSGRFLSPVCFLAALLLASTPLSASALVPILIYGAALGILGKGADPPPINAAGIADERSFYASLTGLESQHRHAPLRVRRPERSPSRDVRSVKLLGSIGVRGYLEGPDVHAIDILGLADPLLARLPSQDRKIWRIGHFERRLPEGYWETLETGSNQIRDRDVAAFYDHLLEITRGRIFSWHRFVTIAKMSFGAFDALIDTERYGKPYSRTLSLGRPEGAGNGDAGLRLAPRNGVLVDLEGERHCASILVELRGGARYRLVYYLGEEPVASYGPDEVGAATFLHQAPFSERPGMQRHRIDVPDDVAAGGYDGVMIYPIDANASRDHGVGRLELCED